MRLLQNFRKTGKTYWREILAVLFLLLGIFFFRSERKELNSLEQHIRAANSTWIWLGISVTALYIFLQTGMYVTAFSAIAGKRPRAPAIERKKLFKCFPSAGGISSLAYSPTSIRQSGLTKMQVHQASYLRFCGTDRIYRGSTCVSLFFLASKKYSPCRQSLMILFVVLVLPFNFRSFQQGNYTNGFKIPTIRSFR
jgi:phosphatidylglycerol lysyltransferase